MANIFAITTANQTTSLNAARHGEAIFTVTDTSARPLRGLAKLRPLGETKQQWLKLAGESERDFAAGSTQQFTVMLDVPADTPPGKYSFRLDIVSVTNPDEDFTEGPTVTAELLPPKPPPPSRAWMIPVALIVLVVIVGTIALIATRKKTVKVPPVEGQKIEQARDMLTKAQLKFTETQVPAVDPSQVGTVKSALPKPGEAVALNSPVVMEVFVPGKVVVKKVLGKTLEEARQILEGEQFLQVNVVHDPIASVVYAPGQVAVQDPAEGASADARAPVKLTLAGPTVRVPQNVRGKALQIAIQMIGDAKLTLAGVVGDQLDAPVENISPAENTPVLEGARITLYVPRTSVPCVTLLCLKLRERIGMTTRQVVPVPTP